MFKLLQIELYLANKGNLLLKLKHVRNYFYFDGLP